MSDEDFRITVGELRQRIKGLPDGMEITFGMTGKPQHLVFNGTELIGGNLFFIDLLEQSDSELAELRRLQNKP